MRRLNKYANDSEMNTLSQTNSILTLKDSYKTTRNGIFKAESEVKTPSTIHSNAKRKLCIKKRHVHYATSIKSPLKLSAINNY